tara:strand:+ start:638 stop:1450 length:813 start_codon:yes stop_codon:yes gene_type:complete
MNTEEEAEKIIDEYVTMETPTVIPAWVYIMVFTLPAIITFYVMRVHFELDLLLTAVTSLAVMNGSINSIIAWLTIRLDGQSAEALDHLDAIMSEMDRLETTLNQASDKVDTFTGDLDEARGLFKKVGVSLDELDLEPVAEVVEKLKENKDGLNDILDNLRGVDVEEYINQAKRIEWKQLLNSAEELMNFVSSSNAEKPISIPTPSIGMPKLPDLTPEPTIEELLDSFEDEEDEDDWGFDDNEDFFDEPSEPAKNLTMKRSKPKKNLTMKR